MQIPAEITAGLDKKKLIVLHVSGESLIQDDIHDGDMVLVERHAPFIEGKIYAINAHGQCTIKHLHRTQDDKARLVPANHDFPENDLRRDRYHRPGTLRLQGEEILEKGKNLIL